MKTRHNFSYEYRLTHPDSDEARICRRLLDRLTDQTLLVNDLLHEDRFFSVDDIRNYCGRPDDVNGEGEPMEIYMWALYPAVSHHELDRLDYAGIPYLKNDYGTWIGITSAGTSWEIYVVAELADALFN